MISVDKTKPDPYIYLGSLYLDSKDYKSAEAALSDGLGRFPNDDELHFYMAMVYEKTGNFDGMVAQLKRTIEINPSYADALNYLGYSYAEKGIKLDKALGLVQKALKLKPDSGYIVDSLGWVYYKMGKFNDALTELTHAVSLEKEDPIILEHLGDVYSSLGRKQDAVNTWEKSIQFGAGEQGLKERVQKKIQEIQK